MNSPQGKKRSVMTESNSPMSEHDQSDTEPSSDSPRVEESYHSFAMEVDDDDQFHPPRVSDEPFFIPLIVEDDQPISNDEYTQELYLQEILTATFFPSSPPPSPVNCIASSSKGKDVSVAVSTKTELTTGEEELEESLLIICEICVEAKETNLMFKNFLCDHSFCHECITKQVATKIQENITLVPCPALNCEGVLDIDAVRSLLPKDVIDKWNDVLCDAQFLGVPKLCCPFKDCCAMMVLDIGMEDITESECPSCRRLFCAMCYVPWHPGVKCAEFQELNKDEKGREDLLVKQLVHEKEWSRCPQCKFYVEKIEGCLHVTCRCKFEFCYRCGKPWTSTHGGCRRN